MANRYGRWKEEQKEKNRRHSPFSGHFTVGASFHIAKFLYVAGFDEVKGDIAMAYCAGWEL